MKMEVAQANQQQERGMRRRAINRAQIPAFGNWDFDQQHQQQQQQVPITQYFDYCANKKEPVLLHHSQVDDHNNDVPQQLQSQHHFDHINNMTTKVVAAEVKGTQQRRRRSCLGVDNNRKVFDITEPIPKPADKCYAHLNDVTSDLYDVGYANFTRRKKDEDLYKIPPELLRKSKRTKKMRKFFTKCFLMVCASY